MARADLLLDLVRAGARGDQLPSRKTLEALAAFDSRKARVVEMQFSGGLSVDETATTLGVSPQTVMRAWRGRGCGGRWARGGRGRSAQATAGSSIRATLPP
jgi:hypothetical protein